MASITPVISAPQISSIPTCICWDYQESTLQKVLEWAKLFFVSLVCYPLCAINRFFQWLIGTTVNPIPTFPLSTDRISRELASFDNPSVRGQINGIYITTNETNLTAARRLFDEHPRLGLESQTIHIGCASWHNFDLMSARRSTYGLIIDFNPKNAEFINTTIAMIHACGSRDAFVQAMKSYLNSLQGPERALFFHPDQRGMPTDRVDLELSREGSWLQTEESYLYIKEQLVSTGRLTAITEDITNFEKFSEIRRVLDREGIALDTVYLSNICNFMETPSKKSAFVKSVKQLLQPNTIFISCPKLRMPNSLNTTILEQAPILGRTVLQRSYDTEQLFEQLAVARGLLN